MQKDTHSKTQTKFSIRDTLNRIDMISDKHIQLIKQFAPLNPYNVSMGLDQALGLIKEIYPGLIIHKYKSRSQVWDWEIPHKSRVLF